jgi:hypothetical protein
MVTQRIAPHLLAAPLLVLAVGCAVTSSDSDPQASTDGLEIDDLSAVPAAACPSGFVCIYAGQTSSSSITNKYFNYGCYKLFDQFGEHAIVNNQTDHAWVGLYLGSSCEKSTFESGWPIHNTVTTDLTPINSIRLSPTALP